MFTDSSILWSRRVLLVQILVLSGFGDHLLDQWLAIPFRATAQQLGIARRTTQWDFELHRFDARGRDFGVKKAHHRRRH